MNQLFDLSGYLAAVGERAEQTRLREAVNEAEAQAAKDAALLAANQYVMSLKFKEDADG